MAQKDILFFASAFLLLAIFPVRANAATEFVSTIMQTGGEYATLNAWNTAVTNGTIDLTATSTLVFAHAGITGIFADGSTVTGVSSGATAVAVHVSPSQILLKNIVGTFQSGEQVRRDASNYVTLSDAGDSVILTVKIDGAWTVADTARHRLSGA